jgi:cardiolipin synthase
VLLDALGSAQMDRSQINQMERAGDIVHRFRPIRPYTVRRLANRSHRRVLVADGKVAMTGGVGIAQEWTGNAQDPDHWRDTHVRMRGPIVRGLQGAFAEHWLEATGEVLGGEDYLPELEPVTEDGGQMQIVRSKSGVGDTNVETMYYLAIASASKSLDLTAAYFAPRPAFTEALADAAERGVEVRILVPGPHIDKDFVRTAGHDAYDRLFDAGARVFEYQPTMLHAKSLVVDGTWSSVGTVNFDNRSFQLHDEVTLCVWDDEFAGKLTEAFEDDIGHSEEIDRESWKDRGLRKRAAETATRAVRREL